MCGINGYIDFSKKELATLPSVLLAMNESIAYRGPDFGDYSVKKNVGLAQRRLSILDLSETGNQPMYDAENENNIVFNGEIYNHIELKKELSAYNFKGTSDTETILYGYDKWGEDLFEKLNGIFSIIIHDIKKNKVLIARDRLGVKPLYYFKDAERLIVSSEIKGILKCNVSPKLNYQSLHEFLHYGYSMNNFTLYEDIFKVGPSCYLSVDLSNSEVSNHTYHELETADCNASEFKDEKNIISKTTQLLENAVKRQLMSDVPIGVFLSGGVDSTAIASIASKYYTGKLNTYTAGFDYYDGQDEMNIAKKTSQQLGTEHHEIHIKGQNISDLIVQLVHHHDEPFSDAANIPLFLMTKELNHTCKVILQGDGGDELFGGYNAYEILNRKNTYKLAVNILKPLEFLNFSTPMKQRVNRFYDILNEKNDGHLIALLSTMETKATQPLHIFSKAVQSKLNSNPFAYYRQLGDSLEGLTINDKLFYINMKTVLPEQFLEKVDKSTMANGIEIRVPFLDNELTSFAMKIPAALKLKNGTKKYLLKKALKNIVPDYVLNAPKKGFGVPYGNWLKEPLALFFRERVYSPYIVSLDIFDHDYIGKLYDDYVKRGANNSFMLWKILNLCIWLEEYKVQL